MEASYGSLSVEELVRLSLGGDRNAFRELHGRYAGILFGRACRLLENRCDAEEVLQDTFMIAWESLAECRYPDGFPFWLQGILRHRVSQVFRQRKTRRIFQEKMVQTGDSGHVSYQKAPEPGEADRCYVLDLLEQSVPGMVGRKVKPVAAHMFRVYRECGDFPSVRAIESTFGLSHGTAERWREEVLEACRRIAVAHGFSLEAGM